MPNAPYRLSGAGLLARVRDRPGGQSLDDGEEVELGTSVSVLFETIARKWAADEEHWGEVVLPGHSPASILAEHFERYLLASSFVHGTILDCASGIGYGTSLLRRLAPKSKVIAMDRNSVLLAYGTKVFRAEAIIADALCWPIRTSSLDSVVSLETIEHLDKPLAFLREVHRCLKPRGTLVVSTPNKLFSSSLRSKSPNPYHPRELTLGELTGLLKEAGFIVVKRFGGRRMSRGALAVRILGSLKGQILRLLGIPPINIRVHLAPAITHTGVGQDGESEEANLGAPHHEVLVGRGDNLFQYFVVVAQRGEEKSFNL